MVTVVTVLIIVGAWLVMVFVVVVVVGFMAACTREDQAEEISWGLKSRRRLGGWISLGTIVGMFGGLRGMPTVEVMVMVGIMVEVMAATSCLVTFYHDG